MQTIDYVQVRADSIIHFTLPTQRHGRYHQFDPNLKTYSGTITDHTRKRLLSACDILVQRTPARWVYNPVSKTRHEFRLAFITLTQPPDRILSARDCYDMLLKPFLKHAKYKLGLKDYIWKYEQQQNGQGHYHIATAQFIEWEKIRWAWNNQLRKSGQLNEFRKRYGHMNPPSTEIKNIVNIDKCLAYLGKEICKKVQNQKATKGKIWDCSIELKRKRFSDWVDEETMQLIDDAVQMGFAELIETDHCRIFKSPTPIQLLSTSMQKDYYQYILT